MEPRFLRWSFRQRAKGELKGFRLPDHTDSRLMHSYHNVAKLRQFRGVSSLRSTVPDSRYALPELEPVERLGPNCD